jgi:AraC family transcriptional activator of pobA
VHMNKKIPFYDLYGEPFIRQEPGAVHVEDIAYRSSELKWEISPHRHNKLVQIVIVFNNSWAARLDEREYQLNGDWGVIIPAGVVHGFHFKPRTQGFVISIDDSFLVSNYGETSLNQLLLKPLTVEFENAARLVHLKHYIELLMYEINYNELGAPIAVEQLLKLILLNIFRQKNTTLLASNARSRETEIVVNFRSLIELNYTSHMTIPDYAEKLHISTSKLNRICKSLLNDSPKAIAHQRLITEAKRRLIYTTQTIDEIALHLGFKDSAYFCRFFKLATNTTPTLFKQQSNIN